jgi:hypothetical protein
MPQSVVEPRPHRHPDARRHPSGLFLAPREPPRRHASAHAAIRDTSELRRSAFTPRLEGLEPSGIPISRVCRDLDVSRLAAHGDRRSLGASRILNPRGVLERRFSVPANASGSRLDGARRARCGHHSRRRRRSHREIGARVPDGSPPGLGETRLVSRQPARAHPRSEVCRDLRPETQRHAPSRTRR